MMVMYDLFKGRGEEPRCVWHVSGMSGTSQV